MKKIFATLCFMLLAASGYSQSFEKGQTDINAGIILNPFLSTSATVRNLVPPVFASVDRGLSNHFSLGFHGQIAMRQRIIVTRNQTVTDLDTTYRTPWAIGISPVYHLRISSRFDFYTGGVVLTNFHGVGLQLLAGAKFRVDDHVAIFLDVRTIQMNAGVSYRFLSKR